MTNRIGQLIELFKYNFPEFLYGLDDNLSPISADPVILASHLLSDDWQNFRHLSVICQWWSSIDWQNLCRQLIVVTLISLFCWRPAGDLLVILVKRIPEWRPNLMDVNKTFSNFKFSYIILLSYSNAYTYPYLMHCSTLSLARSSMSTEDNAAQSNYCSIYYSKLHSRLHQHYFDFKRDLKFYLFRFKAIERQREF